MIVGAAPWVTASRGDTAGTPPPGTGPPGRRSGPRRWLRRTAAGSAWPWLLALALFALYTVVSVRLHLRFQTSGYDLGIFEQAVRSYAAGELPRSEIKGPGYRLLGDHFSPALALLAPFYRIFPSPITLLVAQAALLAVAVVPIVRLARRVLDAAAALVIGLGYGLSWGIEAAVGFDFHEVAFAVPLVALSACALVEGRAAAAVLWALPLLTVKEDLGLTVAVVGGLVWHLGHRVLGGATALVGIAAALLTVLVVLPANNPDGSFAYWKNLGEGDPEASGEVPLAERVTIGLLNPEPKALLLVLLLAPTAFVALRSPLVLLTLPTLAWRLLSNREEDWTLDFHYSAVLMPILFVAFVDALGRWPRHGARTLRRHALTVSALVTAALLPSGEFVDVARPSAWSQDPHVADARAALATIPDGATVSASNSLAPHLTARTEVSVFGWQDARPNPQWIVVDTTAPADYPFASRAQEQGLLDRAREAGYDTVLERGALTVLHRTEDAGDFAPRPAEDS